MPNDTSPASNEAKRKRGTLRPCRARPTSTGRRRGSNLAPPPFVADDIAVAEWDRVAPSLSANGLLTTAQETLLAGYCIAVATAVRAEETLADEGRYYTTKSAGGSTMRRRHPAAQDATENWQAARSFARQLGITGGGIVEAEEDDRRSVFK